MNFSGSSTALTAGMEILDILDDGYLGPNGRILDIHKKFINMLNSLSESTCKGKFRTQVEWALWLFSPLMMEKENTEVY